MDHFVGNVVNDNGSSGHGMYKSSSTVSGSNIVGRQQFLAFRIASLI